MAVVYQCVISFNLCFALQQKEDYNLISVYCNTEFWSLSSDKLSGYIKAQVFSISDSIFLTGTHWFWARTHDYHKMSPRTHHNYL